MQAYLEKDELLTAMAVEDAVGQQDGLTPARLAELQPLPARRPHDPDHIRFSLQCRAVSI
jgi:hypothetical protein